MTRSELTTRLHTIRSLANEVPTTHSRQYDIVCKLDTLINDINGEGVLDVQAPPEIAESMNLPRPAK